MTTKQPCTIDSHWSFNSLAIRLHGRNFVALGFCLPDNPRKEDIFFTEYMYDYVNCKWTCSECSITPDDHNALSEILHNYLKNEQPQWFGVDFIERDLNE